MIHTEMQNIVAFSVPFKPRLLLLHDLEIDEYGKVSLSHHQLISHLILLARMILAKSWKLSEVPVKDKRFQHGRYISLKDKLLYTIFTFRNGDFDAIVVFKRQWIKFLNYWKKIKLVQYFYKSWNDYTTLLQIVVIGMNTFFKKTL